MLVLSRRLNEKILLPEVGATVQVVGIKAGVVRLGICAPPNVTVLREEVKDRAAQWTATPDAPPEPNEKVRLSQLQQLLHTRLKIAHEGLAMLRRQLQAGFQLEAEETLDKLEEDLRMLDQRMADENNKTGAVMPPPSKGCKALLVEDNANERELLATYLRSVGLEVTTASDSTGALDYLHQQGRPDVVFLDMGLPDCDGAQTVRRIRRDPAYAGLKIFAVTGHLPEEFNLADGPEGVDRWFQKPINPAHLVRDLNHDLAVTLCR